ncbi:MAG: ketosynthase, partial [Lysobacter sp.]
MNDSSSSVSGPARLLFAIAYPLLAHWASHDGGGVLAALALADLVLFVSIDGLLKLRPLPWAISLLLLGGLAALAHTPYAQMLLLTPPVLFNGWLAWWFARSLRGGREGLITRIVAALHSCAPRELEPDLYRYTRRLTALWACVLTVLMVVNGVLATIAVPDGLLARLGQVPAIAIGREQWSWFANIINYGVIGGMFAVEYSVRLRLFKQRPE